jgi:hypothetical protein
MLQIFGSMSMHFNFTHQIEARSTQASLLPLSWSFFAYSTDSGRLIHGKPAT